MTIELKPEHQRIIELAIRSGAYQTSDEVVDQAFDILREQRLRLEDWIRAQRERIASQFASGFAQPERGELMDSEEALAILRQRRTDRLKMQELPSFN